MTTTEAQAVQADPRGTYTAGLRALADKIDANPSIPLPYAGSGSEMLIMFFAGSADENKAALAATIAALGGHWEKDYDESSFGMRGTFAGLPIRLCASRGEVCTRVVTGTRVVTKLVPDPAIVVPEVEITEVEEVIEWQCGSLLDPVAQPVIDAIAGGA